jgi:hypothetical protein
MGFSLREIADMEALDATHVVVLWPVAKGKSKSATSY